MQLETWGSEGAAEDDGKPIEGSCTNTGARGLMTKGSSMVCFLHGDPVRARPRAMFWRAVCRACRARSVSGRGVDIHRPF